MTLLDLHATAARAEPPARRRSAAIVPFAVGILVGLLLVAAAQRDIPADENDIWHGNVARSVPA